MAAVAVPIGGSGFAIPSAEHFALIFGAIGGKLMARCACVCHNLCGACKCNCTCMCDCNTRPTGKCPW